jgi:hypothetical protein
MELNCRYRLHENCALNRDFRLVSIPFEDERTGEKRDIPRNIEMFSVMVEKGSVVDVDEAVLPGHYMEPLNDAAKAMVERYPALANPPMSLEEALPIHGKPLEDRASYGNEARRNGDAPVYAPQVQTKLKGAQFGNVAPRSGKPLSLNVPK